MGRKGIGKLAGFGLARSMRVETWQDGGTYCDLTLDVVKLKQPAGKANTVGVPGRVAETAPDDVPWSSGTRLMLSGLKHKSHVDPETLRQSLARRFSRSVRGEMEIVVNGVPVEEPSLDFDLRVPATEGDWQTATLADGTAVRYWYGFTRKVIPTTQLRGWTILVRGKTAQAPNFFFFVEGTASGQHGTKYMTGVIEADDLDAGDDDESDLVSTDRQELDWEAERTAALREWGDKLTREALRARANRRGDQIEKRVYDEPHLRERIERLEPVAQKRIKGYLRILGQADAEDEKTIELAEQLVLAFEYQHFHDVLDELDEEDPEQMTTLLERLRDWKVLESRAILEIVNGRLQIVDKLATLLADDAPETAHRVGDENLHDLLADYPWIINPEWQVLAEEKTITRQLREWGEAAPEGADAKRYDFLALKGDRRLVLVELKRQSHPVNLDDIHAESSTGLVWRPVSAKWKWYSISGGQFDFNYRERPDLERLTWAEIHGRTRTFYEHYRAVLTGEVDDPDFDRRTRELQRTRSVLEHGAYRGRAMRAQGLGVQDVSNDDSEI